MLTALCLVVVSQAVTFEKHVLDTRFISEGVAVADLNRDRKLDVLAGNVWYEAPNWTKHEIAAVPALDPKTQYSNCFHNWAEDLNKDGYPDQILIGMPGEKATWRENPKGKEEPWKEHPLWHSACNESPLYEDLFRNGKRVLIMGTDDQYLAWFEPDKDPYKAWIPHRISEDKGAGSQRYSHGLGVGDLDGDKKNEVLTTLGFYKQPGNGRPLTTNEAWTFTKAGLGQACAHMLTIKDGILTTSAHNRGVWWLKPVSKSEGYEQATIDETISETHAACLMTIGKHPNLITGKRKWAHPPGVDPGSEEPAWLVRYEYRDGKWTRYLIDDSSGVGTQFVIRDINGDKREDIVTANKNGVFLFVQNKP
ncbi:MAG TPA: hypothetical protein VK934_11235 [Fimbriimonas sp.]|nr:hypothetical protein [Fimbriimonas sp.]